MEHGGTYNRDGPEKYMTAPLYTCKLDTETKGSMRFRNSRARGCSTGVKRRCY